MVGDVLQERPSRAEGGARSLRSAGTGGPLSEPQESPDRPVGRRATGRATIRSGEKTSRAGQPPDPQMGGRPPPPPGRSPTAVEQGQKGSPSVHPDGGGAKHRPRASASSHGPPRTWRPCREVRSVDGRSVRRRRHRRSTPRVVGREAVAGRKRVMAGRHQAALVAPLGRPDGSEGRTEGDVRGRNYPETALR